MLRRRALGVGLLFTVTAAVLAVTPQQPTSAAEAGVANPVIQGPITGGARGYAWNHSVFALDEGPNVYLEDEYFFSGTAEVLATGATAAYTSRMVVRRPADPAAFNGIVLIDWMNVTNQQDFEFNWWPSAHDYVMEQGYIHVSLAAQRAGITYTKAWDPVRYAPLNHPGDDYSFDIYSQAIEALRDPANNATSAAVQAPVDPTQGLDVKYVIAGGVSQSAGRLTSFINGGYNRGGVDAYNIERQTASIYEDFSVLVFELNEENALAGRQEPDEENYVVWEEAGASHETTWWWNYRQMHVARDQVGVAGGPDPLEYGCQGINEGRVDYSVRAMLHHTKVWLDTGVRPPSAPRVERIDDTSSTVKRDADGLALGGLRHPFVEVPIGSHTGEGCVFWGHSEQWSDAEIRSRYATHAEYVRLVAAWADHEVTQGWLLPADRQNAVAAAVAFTSPWPDEAPVTFPAAPTSDSESAPAAPPTDEQPTPAPLPATGGGLVTAGLLAVAASGRLRSRPRR